MKRNVQLIFPEALHRMLIDHLFPGDFGEHGAVLAAGLARTPDGSRLLVRDVWLAQEPSDYRRGPNWHMGLQAPFIHRCITRCRDERLVYLAVHNHGGAGRVAFSAVDMASHERGYRALLDIADGMPVGALVVAEGAMEIDLWQPDGSRSALREAKILGSSIVRAYASPELQVQLCGTSRSRVDAYSRQVQFLGREGQSLFKRTKVAIVGLGGIGSLLNEYLARLGVGQLVLIDPDRLELSNASRVVGARRDDLGKGMTTLKTDIAYRVAREASPAIRVTRLVDDFAEESVARAVLECDFIFLAADTMRARLVFNAIVQQYYVPGLQLGTKICVEPDTGTIEAAFSVVRHVRPGVGCLLCNQLIDPIRLADEWKTEAEKRDQHYGVQLPNPSVITMNAVAAAHAVNDFMFAHAGIGTSAEPTPYRRFDHLTHAVINEQPRRDMHCTECGEHADSRFGRGDSVLLPTVRSALLTGTRKGDP